MSNSIIPNLNVKINVTFYLVTLPKDGTYKLGVTKVNLFIIIVPQNFN